MFESSIKNITDRPCPCTNFTGKKMNESDNKTKAPKILGRRSSIHPMSLVLDSSLGEWTEIGPYTRITEAKLGDYSYVEQCCEVIYSEIGRFCSIASHVRINPGNHPVNRACMHHFTYRSRQYGRSKYGIGRTIRVLLDLLTVRFLLSFSTRPIHIFGSLGLMSVLLGVGIGVYLTIIKFLYGADLAERPLLLFAILLVMVGVQLVTMGLLGEMVVRTYYESQDKPIYTVREELGRRG